MTHKYSTQNEDLQPILQGNDKQVCVRKPCTMHSDHKDCKEQDMDLDINDQYMKVDQNTLHHIDILHF